MGGHQCQKSKRGIRCVGELIVRRIVNNPREVGLKICFIDFLTVRLTHAIIFFQRLKIFHGVGDCLVLSLPSPEDIPSIVRRLERVTIGCQVCL